MNEDKPVIITDHAYERAKERFSWSRSACLREATRALRHREKNPANNDRLYSELLRYLGVKNESAEVAVIKDGIVFIFDEGVLITLYKLSNDLNKIVNLK